MAQIMNRPPQNFFTNNVHDIMTCLISMTKFWIEERKSVRLRRITH